MKTTHNSIPITTLSIRILVATAIILLIPFVAMQFSDEVAWSLSDFTIVAVLLLGAGFGYELLARGIRSRKQRLIAAGAIAAITALIWVELAVGIFGTPLSGS